MSRPGILSPGFWLLGSLLCLSFAISMVTYKNGRSPSFRKRLNISEHLMIEINKSVIKLQEKVSCAMEKSSIPNPNNEDNIRNACMGRQSKPGSCWSEENAAVNETLCMEIIYRILMSYEEEIKSFGSKPFLDTVNDMVQALGINKTIEEAPDKPSESYSVCKKQCEFLLTFQQLANTIHRIMNYLISQEKNAGGGMILQNSF